MKKHKLNNKLNNQSKQEKGFLTGKTFLVLFFIAAFVFMFLNLGNIYLWHDEVSTSLIGRNVATFGYPKVYDGKNWLYGTFTPEIGLDTGTENFNKDLVWTAHTWLPYYLVAASFKIFGYTNFAARVLFTLFGFLSLFLIYKLYNTLYPEKKHKKIIPLALILLFTSTFFFTYSRQARYYALLVFFTTGLLISYINILRRNKTRDAIWFAVCGIFLFYSHYVSFFATFLTLTIHFIFFTKPKGKIRKMAFLYAIIALFALPWLIYAQPWHFGQQATVLNLSIVLTILAYLLKSVNYQYPIIILLLLPALICKHNAKNKSNKLRKSKEEIFSDKFLFVFLLFPILIMAFFPIKIYRYIFGLSPLFFLFCSRLFYMYKEKTRTTRIIAIAVLILLMTSTILPLVPLLIVDKAITPALVYSCEKIAPQEKKDRCDIYIPGVFTYDDIKFPIFYYMYEITHDYDGPNEGVIKYLNENAKEDDVVFSYFSGYYIQFYTKLRVLSPEEYAKYLNNESLKPDWIAIRRKPSDLAQPLVDYAKSHDYMPIELDYPGIYDENAPNINGHQFWTVKNAPNIIIYKRPDYNK